MEPAGRNLSNLFGLIKPKKEEPIDPKAPIPIHDPKAPEYRPIFEGWYPARIKFKGLYDLDGLYKFMANYMRQQRYEVYETLYKFKPPEFELRLRGERKKTGFVMDAINIYYHSWAKYDVDAIVDGKKKKMTDGRMVITIEGEIRAPYEDIYGHPRWTSNKIERSLLNLFRKWIARRELESIYWDTLYYEIYKFHGAIKDFLKFEARGNSY